MNMPLVLLNRRRRGNVFTPSALFALAEPGVWYDPSDLTTLFTDTAGTTPVTTPGQTVALALDKSKGLVLGPELVANGDFSSGTGWTAGTGWTISGGVAARTNVSAISGISQTVTAVQGRYYQFTITATVTSGSILGIRLGSTSQITPAITTSGTYTYIGACDGTNNTLNVVAATSFAGTIDNISVRELPGFHATQATAASRPTYGIVPLGGRRNLELRTQDFSNAYWAKSGGSITSSTQTAPDGTATACTLTGNGTGFVAVQGGSVASGTATVSWYVKAGTETKCEIWPSGSVSLARFDLSAVTAVNTNGTGAFITSLGNGWFRIGVSSGSYSGVTRLILGHNGPTLSTSMQIWGVQVETGSSATAYQRVGSAFDVTEAGVASLSYLSFDGVDDSLVTPTITPGIDKAQAFAGVRKLSDAASGEVVGYSADPTANNGAFAVFAPNVFSSVPYWSELRGTSRIYTDTGSFGSLPAPRTNVLSFLYDIGEASAVAELRARVNGSAASLVYNGANAGTGNFLAYPLYIGRRAGSSSPFNGQLYSMIVRFGTNLDAGTITSTETWVNSKTGAYT